MTGKNLTPKQVAFLEHFLEERKPELETGEEVHKYDQVVAFLKNTLINELDIDLSKADAEEYYKVLAGFCIGVACMESLVVKSDLEPESTATYLKEAITALAPKDI